MLLALWSLTACAGSRSQPPPNSAHAPVLPAGNGPLEAFDVARAISWRYSAPASCPSEARLFDQIAQRVPALSASDVAGAVSSSVDIEVQQSGDEWLGRVSFQSATDAVARQVTGADCDEVVVALALITSLWLRPREREAEGPLPDEHAREPSGALAPGAARRSAWAASAARAGDDAIDRDAHDESSDAAALPSERLLHAEGRPPTQAVGAERLARSGKELDDIPGPVRDDAGAARSLPGEPPEPGPLSLGDTAVAANRDVDGDASTAQLQLAGLLGYASQPAGAFSARLQVERWGSANVSSWSSALGVAYATGKHQNERLGAAGLRLLLAQLELCPPGLDVASSVWVRACVHGRAGALHFSAETDRVPDARSLWRPWGALGPSLHLGVPVSSGLSLRLLAELSLVVVRDEFATARALTAGEPSPADVFTFYEISPVSFDVGLGAAHVF